jgi:hypothetical protein
MLQNIDEINLLIKSKVLQKITIKQNKQKKIY